MAIETILQDFTKRAYDPEKWRKSVLGKSPFMNQISGKTKTFVGDDLEVSINRSVTGAAYPDFAEGQTNLINPEGKRWRFSDTPDLYGWISLTNKDIERMNSNLTSVLNATSLKIDGALSVLKQAIHPYLWGEGVGDLGKISAVTTISASDTFDITFSNRYSVMRFNPGALIQFTSDKLALNGTAANLYSVIQRGSVQTGTMRIQISGAYVQDPVVDDFVVIKGSLNNVIQGVGSYIIPAGVALGTKFNVDQAENPDNYSGLKVAYQGTLSDTIAQGLVDLDVTQEGSRDYVAWLSPADYLTLTAEAQNPSYRRVNFNQTSGAIGLGDGSIMITAADVTVVCRQDVGKDPGFCHIIHKDSWGFYTIGGKPLIRLALNEPDWAASDKQRALNTAPGFSTYAFCWAEFVCNDPGLNAVCTLTP